MQTQLRVFVFAALAVIPAVVIAQGDVPECVLNCATTAATVAGCQGPSDLTCICSSQAFLSSATSCVLSQCPDDAQVAQQLLTTECQSVTSVTPSSTPPPSSSPSSTQGTSPPVSFSSSNPFSTIPTAPPSSIDSSSAPPSSASSSSVTPSSSASSSGGESSTAPQSSESEAPTPSSTPASETPSQTSTPSSSVSSSSSLPRSSSSSRSLSPVSGGTTFFPVSSATTPGGASRTIAPAQTISSAARRDLGGFWVGFGGEKMFAGGLVVLSVVFGGFIGL